MSDAPHEVLPKPLADAVLWLMAFLELSDDSVVDPDAAVNAMEGATYELLSLTRAQREALAARAQELADEVRLPAQVAFFRAFAEACGLLDDDAP